MIGSLSNDTNIIILLTSAIASGWAVISEDVLFILDTQYVLQTPFMLLVNPGILDAHPHGMEFSSLAYDAGHE